jgi:hypothetical protein
MGWTTEESEFEFRQGKEFSLLHSVHTGSGAQWIPGAFSMEIKRPGREADHSPPASAEVKRIWIYTSTPPYGFVM